jgi:hypothetical protein
MTHEVMPVIQAGYKFANASMLGTLAADHPRAADDLT